MSSSVLRIFAVILAIGAITIGYLGYKASKQPPNPEPVAVEVVKPKGEHVVFAARDIPAGRIIGEDALTTALVPIRPVRSYTATTSLIGRKVRIGISPGEMVLSSHFPLNSVFQCAIQASVNAISSFLVL